MPQRPSSKDQQQQRTGNNNICPQARRGRPTLGPKTVQVPISKPLVPFRVISNCSARMKIVNSESTETSLQSRVVPRRVS